MRFGLSFRPTTSRKGTRRRCKLPGFARLVPQMELSCYCRAWSHWRLGRKRYFESASRMRSGLGPGCLTAKHVRKSVSLRPTLKLAEGLRVTSTQRDFRPARLAFDIRSLCAKTSHPRAHFSSGLARVHRPFMVLSVFSTFFMFFHALLQREDPEHQNIMNKPHAKSFAEKISSEQ